MRLNPIITKPASLTLIAAGLLAGGCGSDESPGAAADEQVKVVATTMQLQDFARQAGGDRVQVTGVLGPGTNAHGPNEYLHVPYATALTGAVAHLLTAHAGR